MDALVLRLHAFEMTRVSEGGDLNVNEAFAAQYATEEAAKCYGKGSWPHVGAELYSAHIDKLHDRGDWLGDWHDKVKQVAEATEETSGRGSWPHVLGLARGALEFPEDLTDSFLSAPQGDYISEAVEAFPALLATRHEAPWPCTPPIAVNLYLRLLQLQLHREPSREVFHTALSAFQQFGTVDIVGGWVQDMPFAGAEVGFWHSSSWPTMQAILQQHPEFLGVEERHLASQVAAVVETQAAMQSLVPGALPAFEASAVASREAVQAARGAEGLDRAVAVYNEAQCWLARGDLPRAQALSEEFVSALPSELSAEERAPWLMAGARAALHASREGDTQAASRATALCQEAAEAVSEDTARAISQHTAAAAWVHLSELHWGQDPQRDTEAGARALRWTGGLPCGAIDALHPLHLHHAALHAAGETEAAAGLMQPVHWPPEGWGNADDQARGGAMYWGKVWAAGFLAMASPVMLFLAAVAPAAAQ